MRITKKYRKITKFVLPPKLRNIIFRGIQVIVLHKKIEKPEKPLDLRNYFLRVS
jgi:hypothetical protein